MKAPVNHALAIERHILATHHLGEPRVRQHLGVDPVAGPRLEDDVGEEDRLAALQLHAAREGGPFPDLDVVGDALAELERTVLLPDLAGLLGHAPIGWQLFLRHRNYETIRVRHVLLLSWRLELRQHNAERRNSPM